MIALLEREREREARTDNIYSVWLGPSRSLDGKRLFAFVRRDLPGWGVKVRGFFQKFEDKTGRSGVGMATLGLTERCHSV